MLISKNFLLELKSAKNTEFVKIEFGIFRLWGIKCQYTYICILSSIINDQKFLRDRLKFTGYLGRVLWRICQKKVFVPYFSSKKKTWPSVLESCPVVYCTMNLKFSYSSLIFNVKHCLHRKIQNQLNDTITAHTSKVSCLFVSFYSLSTHFFTIYSKNSLTQSHVINFEPLIKVGIISFFHNGRVFSTLVWVKPTKKN